MSFGGSLMIGMGWEKFSFFGKISLPCPTSVASGRTCACAQGSSKLRALWRSIAQQVRSAQSATAHSASASCAQPATTLRAHSWSSFYSQPPTLFVRSSFSLVTLCCLFICATCVLWLQDKLWTKNLPRSFEGPTKFDQISANLKLLALPPNTNPNSTAFALKCETSNLHCSLVTLHI